MSDEKCLTYLLTHPLILFSMNSIPELDHSAVIQMMTAACIQQRPLNRNSRSIKHGGAHPIPLLVPEHIQIPLIHLRNQLCSLLIVVLLCLPIRTFDPFWLLSWIPHNHPPCFKLLNPPALATIPRCCKKASAVVRPSLIHRFLYP